MVRSSDECQGDDIEHKETESQNSFSFSYDAKATRYAQIKVSGKTQFSLETLINAAATNPKVLCLQLVAGSDLSFADRHIVAAINSRKLEKLCITAKGETTEVFISRVACSIDAFIRSKRKLLQLQILSKWLP